MSINDGLVEKFLLWITVNLFQSRFKSIKNTMNELPIHSPLNK